MNNENKKGYEMKKLILLLMLSTSSIFGMTLECSTFKGYRIGAPKNFTLKMVRGDQRGKIEGMTTLDGKEIRKKPVYGTFKIWEYEDMGGYEVVEFESDISSGSLWDFAFDYYIEISNERDSRNNDNNLYSGILKIQGEKGSIRCALK